MPAASNAAERDQVSAAYDDVVVHAPGRPFRQLALGDRERHTETRPRPDGKPVLLVAGDADPTGPGQHARYLTAGAPAELLPAPGHQPLPDRRTRVGEDRRQRARLGGPHGWVATVEAGYAAAIRFTQ